MQISSDQLKKFLQGNCSEEEKREILAYYKTEASEEQFKTLFIKHWQDPEGKDYAHEIDSRLLFEKIESEIKKAAEKSNKGSFTREPYKSKYISLSFFKYAAVIAILLLSLFFIYDKGLLLPFHKDQASYDITNKSTRKGQKSIIRLSDGTKVVLNSGSTLRYPKTFPDSCRKVTLIGEAYFEVAKDSDRPFSITSGELVTTALGTAFNINAYALDEIVVSLASGKVSITKSHPSAKDENYILTPGNALTYHGNTGEFNMTKFDFKNAFLWKEGIIYFEKAAFEDIVKKLELWYGVDIEVFPNSNDIKLYTGEFEKESLRNVLESISYSLEFDFSIHKRKVEIMFHQNNMQ